MKILVAALTGVVIVLLLTGSQVESRPSSGIPFGPLNSAAEIADEASRAPKVALAALDSVVKTYCAGCHNATDKPAGNLSLVGYSVASATDRLDVSEKVIRKLRAEMMPPPNATRRPSPDTLRALVQTLESVIDKAARPSPGARTFQRLNRAEYARAIRDLFDLEVNAGNWLPLDTKSSNFDNIADVQMLSPTLLDAYLNAASAVSRLALGDPDASPTVASYTSSPFDSQHPWNYVEGAPYGTRGGIVVNHIFPADGVYSFRINVAGGVGTRLESIDVSIDGERVALLHYERGMERSLVSADAPLGADYVRSEPIEIKAGQKKVSVAFLKRFEGPYEDLVKPHDWSRAGNGTASSGTTAPPYILDMLIAGPQKPAGVSETPSRKAIFTCRPETPEKEMACADEIITRIATRAYRRPLAARDKEGLLAFYEQGAERGGFEEGIRSALQATLSSPHFYFRMEAAPANVKPGAAFKLSDVDLASRLSFFLWGSLPDEELLKLAQQRKLSDKKNLERQVRRMLADPRSEALATRFASQWLRLQDLEKVRPDAFWFPDYNQQIADAMLRETELFFNYLVREDRPVLDVFTADYTFVNELLARHYGIPDVSGNAFRKVKYPDDRRRGILGHGSILVQTSLGNRTSPVLRGKWVMEVLLGNPPPPPPPNVPDLEETEDTQDGKQLTTRERMELHRKNATCKACHQYMDPMGLALDNFDVTGRWRYRENGMPLDTRGNMYDGTPVETPSDLANALMKRPIPLVRAFTENLMAYALGRRVEDFDQPTIRSITRDAEANGYRMSSFIMGIVNSPAFQSKTAETVAETQDKQQR